MCLFGSHFSDATAYIPSPRLRAEKAPLEQSKLLTCCNLTPKRKRTRPCNDCPTSSLDMILRVPQAVVCSHWITASTALQPRLRNLQLLPPALSNYGLETAGSALSGSLCLDHPQNTLAITGTPYLHSDADGRASPKLPPFLIHLNLTSAITSKAPSLLTCCQIRVQTAWGGVSLRCPAQI